MHHFSENGNLSYKFNPKDLNWCSTVALEKENPIKIMLDSKDIAVFTLLLSRKINLDLIQC